MPWEGINESIFNAPNKNTCQLWKGSVKEQKTCMADDMCILSDEVKQKVQTVDNYCNGLGKRAIAPQNPHNPNLNKY